MSHVHVVLVKNTSIVMVNFKEKLNIWYEPILVAKCFEQEDYLALLCSGKQNDFTGRYSYLGVYADKILQCNSFAEFEDNFKGKDQKYLGYLSYDLKNTLENVPDEAHDINNLPLIYFVNFKIFLIFDHMEQTISVEYNDVSSFEKFNLGIKNIKTEDFEGCIDIKDIKSSMTNVQYAEKFNYIKEAIARGDIYQANLTRKFYGKYSKNEHSNLGLLAKLIKLNPSVYAAYFKFKDLEIVSNTPEQFIKIEENGYVETRPIKGTIPVMPGEDPELKAQELLASEKNRAENLMIVDLMRNDFSKSCKVGSVQVKGLYELTKHSNLIHLHSTITGQLCEGEGIINLIRNCFPPGSMTGAPKIKAMEICANLENYRRGIYSGALGYLNTNNSGELAVVIRTIIFKGDNFEFQAGGAITSDSILEEEHNELLTKVKYLAKVIGLDLNLYGK